ncbi:MAG: peptide chain release factor N(5)-glutamine methyltransferase [Gammaproteobacteria bacterium]|nr:peptide chain release factor N(5)-glutamine methyltransferase [Gammaproteobacteria bacterium]
MSEQIDKAIRWATRRIGVCSESARLDAELLLAHCLDKPRSYLYSWPEQMLSEPCWQRFQDLVQKRLQPTPIAYLLGNREFFSMEYATTPAALVPRPETELLVELALELIPVDAPKAICDLGTGTGIIAITLKKQRPLTNVCATDVDSSCLALARENAQRHSVEIDFIESNWYQSLEPGRRFDLIVSNPPYVAANHPFLAQGDLPAEPQIALTPGTSGLEALDIIIGSAPDHLEPGGTLILEHGYDQEVAVAALLKAHGFADIRCESDHNDLPRTTIAHLPQP